MKQKKAYRDDIKKLKLNIYANGEKIKNPLDSDLFTRALKTVARTYGLQHDPEYHDLLTFHSSLVNKKVCLWTSLFSHVEDLSKLAEAIKALSSNQLCIFCMPNAFNCAWAFTYDLDQEKGTRYHENLKRILTKVQEEDLRFSIALMDARGDRSLKPGKQIDEDMYLRVVDKTKEGIVVRGAKAHHTYAPLTHYMLVMPCRAMESHEKEYAIAFVLPTDTKGITYLCNAPGGPSAKREYEHPISQRIGFVESLTIFDDVLVPWDNLLMCEEWEFTRQAMQYFSSFARFVKNTCTSARIDLLIGVASLLAKYNGIEKASHVKEKLLEMMMYSEMSYGCTLAALGGGYQHPSGVVMPGFGKASASLYLMRQVFPKFMGYLHDLGGGIIYTIPGENAYKDEKTNLYLKKYLKGSTKEPVEDRLKAIYLARDLVASDLTGYLLCSVLDAAGGMEPNKLDVWRSYNLPEKQMNAGKLAGIKTQGQ